MYTGQCAFQCFPIFTEHLRTLVAEILARLLDLRAGWLWMMRTMIARRRAVWCRIRDLGLPAVQLEASEITWKAEDFSAFTLPRLCTESTVLLCFEAGFLGMLKPVWEGGSWSQAQRPVAAATGKIDPIKQLSASPEDSQTEPVKLKSCKMQGCARSHWHERARFFEQPNGKLARHVQGCATTFKRHY